MLCGALTALPLSAALRGAGSPPAAPGAAPTSPPADTGVPHEENPTLPGPAPDEPRVLPARGGPRITEDTSFDDDGMAMRNEPTSGLEEAPRSSDEPAENLANEPEGVVALSSAGLDERVSVMPGWHVGPTTVHLESRLGVVYDDNILVSQDRRQADWTYVLAGGISLRRCRG